MPDWSKPDTLIKAAAKKVGLIDLLGEDLYSILESGRIEKEMPFGVKSKFDFRKQNINLRKRFDKDLTFNFDIKPFEEDYKLRITKKF